LFFRPIGAVVVAVAFSFVTATAAFAAPDNGTGGTSANWAGYAVSGQSYNFVTATWVEPAMPVPCVFGSSGPSLGSFRTGFDGYGNGTSEQVGTLIECIPNGPPSGATTPMVVKHAGFYQMVPGSPGFGVVFCNPEPPTTTKGCTGSFALKAGDRVTATASYANGTFTFGLYNHRTHQSATATAASTAPRTSAEAVVETPVPAPLTDFGKVTFQHFAAHTSDSSDEQGNHEGDNPTAGDNAGDNADQNDGENGHSKPVAITMKAGTVVRAEPSHLHDGDFTVSWQHA